MARVLEESPRRSHERSVVIIGRRSLQNRLVARLIDEHLGCECQVRLVYQSSGEVVPRGAIALLDVEGMSAREIRTHARAVLASAPYGGIALMNVDEDTADEVASCPGVQGIFFRDSSREQLLKGLHAMLAGEHWLPGELAVRFHEREPGPPASYYARVALTRKEKETLYLLLDGHSNSAIAVHLGVSPHTVKTHLYNLSLKIGARNRVQAVKWAMENLERVDRGFA